MVEQKVSLCNVNFLCIARVSNNFTSARFGAVRVVFKVPFFWGVMLWRVVHSILKAHCAWICSVKLDCFALKMKAV